jgi:hypothetical protein
MLRRVHVVIVLECVSLSNLSIVDFSMSKVKHEVHSIFSINLTIANNVVATKITRRNTMHKNTRSIPGNPSQQGKKTQPKSFAILFKRKTFTTNKTYHTRGCSNPRRLAPRRGAHFSQEGVLVEISKFT